LGEPTSPINLGISNVIHFADWQPGKQYLIAYSTVEPRASAPGWDANNDLHFLYFENGTPGTIRDILDTNYGGIYPWWGMTFTWSPDGEHLAYARPDGIGLVDTNGSGLVSLVSISPLNTHAPWAWTPGLAWGSDNQTLFLVSHAAPSGLETPEESPNFDLNSISLADHSRITLIPQTGMFAYPATSSFRESELGSTYFLSFLQAIFPAQSATSRYRLIVCGSDGSKQHQLFPPEGQPGLEPQKSVWSPRVINPGTDYIGIVYEGNLWIVEATSGLSQQVTGDGLTSKIDWK
jgi:hypothetical protein